MHQDLACDLHACNQMKEGRKGRGVSSTTHTGTLPGLTAVPLTGKETALSSVTDQSQKDQLYSLARAP